MVQAGVDPHADDRLGRLALSDAGLVARDEMVRRACLAAGVPFMATLGGGYDADVARLGRRHAASLLALAGLAPYLHEADSHMIDKKAVGSGTHDA
jgi:acetoin utilization deacetylase AcuC-like enzyme